MNQMSWKTQLAVNPQLADMKNWPVIDMTALNKKQRKRFLINRTMVQAVLSDRNVSQVAKESNISTAWLYQLLNKCLSSSLDESPMLTKGLIAYSRKRTKNHRQLPLSTVKNPQGAAGSFQYLFNALPSLEKYLINKIELSIKDKPVSENISIKRLHQDFIWYLRQQQWPETCYPFTETSMASESLRCWYHHQCEQAREIRYPTRTSAPRISESYLLEEIQLDEQLTDINACCWIEFLGNRFPVRLSRCSLILMIDKVTRYILAFQFVLNKACDQHDLLMCLAKIKQYQPHQLHGNEFKYPDLTQEQQAALETLKEIQVAQLTLDNALCHHAHSVADLIVDDWKATLNAGLVKTPTRRCFIEYAYKLLNDDLHRFNSTTGSHTQDPKKESRINYKKAPQITVAQLEDAISILITESNTMQQASLGGLSPIEKIVQLIEQKKYWKQPASPMKRFGAYTYSKKLSLIISTTEKRRPYCSFFGARYTLQSMQHRILKTQDVRAECSHHDIRKLWLFTLTGEAIGEALVSKQWQLYPHSIKTRGFIQKTVKAKRLRGKDPLREYFDSLCANKAAPAKMLELVRISREFSSYQLNLTPPPDSPKNTLIATVPASISRKTDYNKYHWSTDNALRRP